MTDSGVQRHKSHLLKSGYQSSKNGDDRYLVDPASSYMLVSKIKPCMSKYKQIVQ